MKIDYISALILFKFNVAKSYWNDYRKMIVITNHWLFDYRFLILFDAVFSNSLNVVKLSLIDEFSFFGTQNDYSVYSCL